VKTADVKSMATALDAARQYVAATQQRLEYLRGQRSQLHADVTALTARPLPWPENVDVAVNNAISNCAEQYVPSLEAFILERNPNLAARDGYADLPFLSVAGMNLQGTVSAAALCFFFPDLLAPRLRDLLANYPAPFPPEQCVTGKDRAAQHAVLAGQLEAAEREITDLENDLAQLTT
jgi:hypothetical protein